MAKDLLVHNSQTRNPELLGFFEGIFALANPGEYISIGKKTEETKCGWIQVNYRLSDLLLLLRNGEAVILGDDLYFAPNTFRTPYSRTKENLASLNSFYIDLDYDKINGLKGAHPEQVLDKAITCCNDNGLPRPSCAVATGHGLHLYWLLDKPLKYSAETEESWLNVQKALCGMLAGLGADRSAIDAARVLRIPGTLNAKDKTDKREVFCVSGGPAPLRVNYQAMLRWARAHSAEKTGKKKAPKKKSGSTKRAKPAAPERMQPEDDEMAAIWREVNTARAGDFDRLVELRGGDMGGYRNCLLFYYRQALVGMQRFDTNKIRAAVYKMNAHFTQPLSEKEVEDVLSKPRYYKQKNEALIRIFHITAEEQTQLKTLISDDEYKRRRVLKNKYQMNYADKTEHFCMAILSCMLENMSATQIGEKLKIARSTVYNYIQKFDLKAIAEGMLAAGIKTAEMVRETIHEIVTKKLKPRKKPKRVVTRKKAEAGQEKHKTTQPPPPLPEWPSEDELASLDFGPSPYKPSKEEYQTCQPVPMQDQDAIDSLVLAEAPPQAGKSSWYAPLDDGTDEIEIIEDEDNAPAEPFEPLVMMPLPPGRRTVEANELFVYFASTAPQYMENTHQETQPEQRHLSCPEQPHKPRSNPRPAGGIQSSVQNSCSTGKKILTTSVCWGGTREGPPGQSLVRQQYLCCTGPPSVNREAGLRSC